MLKKGGPYSEGIVIVRDLIVRDHCIIFLKSLLRLDENIKMKNEIDGTEVDTHGGVKKLLRRYEKYRVSKGMKNYAIFQIMNGS